MIRVVLPPNLRVLAGTGAEIRLEIRDAATLKAVLDALEDRHPMLRGTIRDHASQRRRPYLRFFACRQDISHMPPDTPLPEEVLLGHEPLMIVGAIAGG